MSWLGRDDCGSGVAGLCVMRNCAGQQLVWPGEFLLGEPQQNTEQLLDAAAPPEAPTHPDWARRGSYLVCRRLRQDVPGFWNFAAAAATRAGTTPEHVASTMVGRWPSGAPLMRVATADDPVLAGDEFANNNFLFDDDTRPFPLRPIPGYPGDNFPRAKGDMLGTVCPNSAHIRKTHPRDTATELGKPHDTMLRMILRRGIAYGEPYLGAAHPDPDADRGLMFLCYGATIEDQFEFLTRRWSNLPNQPKRRRARSRDRPARQPWQPRALHRRADSRRIDRAHHHRARLGGPHWRRLLLRPTNLRPHHRPAWPRPAGSATVTTAAHSARGAGWSPARWQRRWTVEPAWPAWRAAVTVPSEASIRNQARSQVSVIDRG